jgi:TonB family protein
MRQWCCLIGKRDFFPKLSAALDGLAGWVSEQLRLGGKPLVGAVVCKCQQILIDGHWTEVERTDPELTQLHVVSTVPPEFSELARRAKGNGSVLVVAQILESGKVGEMWLAQAVGLGLDEKATKAVGAYRFEPEKYKGKAVGAAIAVEVQFQVY